MGLAAPELEDHVIEHLLDEALAPFRGKFSDERLRAAREALGDVLAAHPGARATVRSLLPEIAVDESGAVRKDGEVVDEERRRQGG